MMVKGEVQTQVVRQWIVAILANTILLSYGLQTGWISAATPTLKSDKSTTGTPLSESEIMWLGSSPSLGAIVSVAIFSYLVNVIGRKYCIVIFGIFQAVSWIIKLCPSNMTSLLVAQVCLGAAAGGCFSVVPMYVKEISQDNIRGTLGLLLTLMQYFGVLAMYAMGGYLNYNTVLWIVVGIPVVNAFLMIKAPESPTYLVKIGKIEEAAANIAFLRGISRDEKLVQNEIDAIKFEDEKFKAVAQVSFIGIFKHPVWRKGFLYMIFVMIAHGVNGAFAIITFASTILKTFGVTLSPELQSLSIPAFMIFSALFTMTFIDRLGRKAILGGGFALAVLSNCSMAAILIVQQEGYIVPMWLPIAAILASVVAYAAGVGSCPFVIMSEMFTFQIRAKVMGFLVFLGWSGSFVQLFGYSTISDIFGSHIAFLCFAGFNLMGMFVTLILLPETSGKSVDQIEKELEKRTWGKGK